MTSFSLAAVPADLHWHNSPEHAQIEETESTLTIIAGENTDWFIDPNGTFTRGNAPVALFAPSDGDFRLSTKVTVDFAATYDAGVLFLYVRDDVWAKACFEFSPQNKPMIVTVVTRGTSDDCNSTVIDGNTVYLRVARIGQTFAIHFSLNGEYWQLARYFTLGTDDRDQLQTGFSAQSPTGQRCKVTFTDIRYQPGALSELRSGE